MIRDNKRKRYKETSQDKIETAEHKLPAVEEGGGKNISDDEENKTEKNDNKTMQK